MTMTRRTAISLPIAASFLNIAARAGIKETPYFPQPDTQGGWRTLDQVSQIRSTGGLDKGRLDEVFEYVKTTSRDGGLLVLRHGYLAYERYFGRAMRNANPNLFSMGKMFTSASCGIMLSEHKDRFPDGLAQKVFTREYLPQAFPLGDSRMADIQFGNLLTFTSGIWRGNYIPPGTQPPVPVGNSTGIVRGENVKLPDWYSSDPMYNPILNQDSNAAHGKMWVAPGGGYLYGLDAHVASIVLRNVVEMELQEFINQRLAKPMGFGTWGYVLHFPEGTLPHTPGQSGISLHSTDVLRFGYMLLNKGKWNDQQLVPREYIELLSHPSPFNPHSPFSLLFEVNSDGHVARAPRDAYFKSGAGGRGLYVIPSLDMVVYKMSGADDPEGTGLPPANDPNPDTSRDNWKPHAFNQFNDGPVDGDTGVRRTLELITNAVVV